MLGGAVGPLIQAHASELFSHYSVEDGGPGYSGYRAQSLVYVVANVAALLAVLSLIRFNRIAASAGGGVYIVGSLLVRTPQPGSTRPRQMSVSVLQNVKNVVALCAVAHFVQVGTDVRLFGMYQLPTRGVLAGVDATLLLPLPRSAYVRCSCRALPARGWPTFCSRS